MSRNPQYQGDVAPYAGENGDIVSGELQEGEDEVMEEGVEEQGYGMLSIFISSRLNRISLYGIVWPFQGPVRPQPRMRHAAGPQFAVFGPLKIEEPF